MTSTTDDLLVRQPMTAEMRAEIDRARGLWKEGIDYRLPPDDQARKIDEALHAVWNVDQPAMASVRSFELGGNAEGTAAACDAVLYQPFDAVAGIIFYIHGGGWALCSLQTHERFMRYLAQTSRLAVVGIHYRLAPQHPYPAALTDVIAAYRDLVANRETHGLPAGEMVVAGDSAGANLALGLMLHESAAGMAMPAGGLLFYGAFGLDFQTQSHRLYGTDDYLLSTFQMGQFWSWYVPDAKDREDPLAVPLHANDVQLRDLPPLFLVAAELDPLADDTRRLKTKLAAANRNDQFHIERGVVHGFLQMTAFLDAARKVTALAADAANDFLTRTLRT